MASRRPIWQYPGLADVRPEPSCGWNRPQPILAAVIPFAILGTVCAHPPTFADDPKYTLPTVTESVVWPDKPQVLGSFAAPGTGKVPADYNGWSTTQEYLAQLAPAVVLGCFVTGETPTPLPVDQSWNRPTETPELTRRVFEIVDLTTGPPISAEAVDSTTRWDALHEQLAWLQPRVLGSSDRPVFALPAAPSVAWMIDPQPCVSITHAVLGSLCEYGSYVLTTVVVREPWMSSEVYLPLVASELLGSFDLPGTDTAPPTTLSWNQPENPLAIVRPAELLGSFDLPEIEPPITESWSIQDQQLISTFAVVLDTDNSLDFNRPPVPHGWLRSTELPHSFTIPGQLGSFALSFPQSYADEAPAWLSMQTFHRAMTQPTLGWFVLPETTTNVVLAEFVVRATQSMTEVVMSSAQPSGLQTTDDARFIVRMTKTVPEKL